MANLQAALANDPQACSSSPSPSIRKPTRRRFSPSMPINIGADPNRWWFLTGPQKPLYDLIRKRDFFLGVEDNTGKPLRRRPIQSDATAPISRLGRWRRQCAWRLQWRADCRATGRPRRLAARYQESSRPKKRDHDRRSAPTSRRTTSARRRMGHCRRSSRSARIASLFLLLARSMYHPPADVATGTHLAFSARAQRSPERPRPPSPSSPVFHFILVKAIVTAHRASMFAAFIFSSLFLVCLHRQLRAARRDEISRAWARIRWVYFPLLISHIILAVVALADDSSSRFFFR